MSETIPKTLRAHVLCIVLVSACALGFPADALGFPADALAEPADALAEPTDALAEPTDATADGDGPFEMPTLTTTVIGKRPPPPGTNSRIDAKEIALRGARNLAEAIAGEPSVEVNPGPKSGATLQVRGFDERAVLLMIDDQTQGIIEIDPVVQ